MNKNRQVCLYIPYHRLSEIEKAKELARKRGVSIAVLFLDLVNERNNDGK